jgi:branched-chain amino acid transport system permease protein
LNGLVKGKHLVLLEYLLNGILIGALYGLLAFPICVLFSSTGYVDLAIGVYAIVAAMVAYVVGGTLGTALGLLAAVAVSSVTALVALRLDKAGSDHVTIVIASYAVFVFLESLVLTVHGKDPMIVRQFDHYLNVSGLLLDPQALLNFAICAILLLLLFGMLFFSSVGRDLRASAVNPLGGELAGVPVRVYWFCAYLLGGLLAGVAGVLLLHTVGLEYGGGMGLIIPAFGAALLFGIKSPVRSFVGGIVIGVVQSLSAGYLDGGWVSAVPVLFIFAVLVWGRSNALGAQAGRV